MYNSEYDGHVTPARYHPSNGSVTCYSPPINTTNTPDALYAQHNNFTLQLSFNRLHFEAVSGWEYYADAVISSVSPASGPLTGGAQLMILGSGFESGSHANCWLGNGRSNATAYEGGSRLRCVSPPGDDFSSEAYRTQVRISLNAQQASDQSNFSFYPTPAMLELVPDSGDAARAEFGPGTLVSVRLGQAVPFGPINDPGSGSGEVGGDESTMGTDHGTDYRCRFGGSDGAIAGPRLPPSYLPLILENGAVGSAPTSVRPATLVGPNELRCTAPHDATPATVDFRVSLNGQQYGPKLDFDLLEPPLITGVETGFSGRLEGRSWIDGETDWTGGASGLYTGGTLVEVHGHHFANRTQVGGRLSCRFGVRDHPHREAATVEATFVNDRLVRCYSPPADAAALSSEWLYDFDDGVKPPNALLLGDARLVDGSLRLTEPIAGQIGGFVLEPINRGARYFEARFSVLMGGGVGGDGMSFCYGELSHTPGGVFNESLTEMGVQYDGLCVRLRTHTTLGIEITACKRNQCTTLNGVRIGGALRTESFAPVTFSRLPGEGVKAAFEAGPNGTSIELNVSEADLSPYYEPAVTWRFGFGARCGQYADGHHVDAISIRSPAFVSTHTLPFSVANNGQQFSEAAGGTSAAV